MEKLENMFGSLTEISDPFKKDCITDINFYYRRFNLWGDEVNEFSARVVFKNGSTSGEHKIKASTFPDLYKKVISFCNAL